MPTFKITNDMPSWLHHQVTLMRDTLIESGKGEGMHDWAFDIQQEYDGNFITYTYDYFRDEKDFNVKELADHLNAGKIIVFNCTCEGYSINDVFTLKSLHYAIKDFMLDASKIFFVTGNLAEVTSYNAWCKNNGEQKIVQILELMDWDYAVASDHTEDFHNIDKYFNHRKTALNERVTKYFINLSRRTRIPRTYLSYKFHKMPEHWRMISHDGISNEFEGYEAGLRATGCVDWQEVSRYMKLETPFIADTQDFETNWANYLNEDLHLETYFSVVSETFQENWNSTSMFFSEKTFKPILLGQPFLVYGQQGCNNFLKKLGYKIYEDRFDYSFDYILDNYERADALHDEVEKVCKLLDGMVLEERYQWAFQNIDILKHNINNMIRLKNIRQIMAHPILDNINKRHGVNV